MAIYHASCRIISATRGQSAIAHSAYISGEVLHSERDGLTKDYRRAHQDTIGATFVLLPDAAPKEYADRETLWNAVETFETKKTSNARFARAWDFALPNELTEVQQKKLVYDFCMEAFVSRGMIVDGAIHLNKGNNHFHPTTTTRPLNKDGSWGAKSKKVFDLDENGERIPVLDKHGNQKKEKNGKRIWKSHKENSTDWDTKETLLAIRKLWADKVNAALRAAGRKERVTEKAYKDIEFVYPNGDRIKKEPTRHLGPARAQMEKRGIQTRVGEINLKANQVNMSRMDCHIINVKKQKLAREIEEAERREAEEKRRVETAARHAEEERRAAEVARLAEIEEERRAEEERQAVMKRKMSLPDFYRNVAAVYLLNGDDGYAEAQKYWNAHVGDLDAKPSYGVGDVYLAVRHQFSGKYRPERADDPEAVDYTIAPANADQQYMKAMAICSADVLGIAPEREWTH